MEFLTWLYIWDHRFLSFIIGKQTAYKMFFMVFACLCISLGLFTYIVVKTYGCHNIFEETRQLVPPETYKDKSYLKKVDEAQTQCMQIKYLGQLMTAFMCLLMLNILLLIKSLISAFRNLPGRCVNSGSRDKPSPNQLGPQAKQGR